MFQKNSDTSREAYETLRNKNTLAERIRKEVEAAGIAGITNGWIADKLDMQTSTTGARLVELEQEGRIVKLKRTMKNPSGKQAHVYVVTAYLNQLDRADVIPPMAQKQRTNESVKKILEDVDTHVALGTPIHPNSELHKRILMQIACA